MFEVIFNKKYLMIFMVIKCDIWRNGNEGRKVIKALVLSLRDQQSVYGYWREFGCLTSLFLLSCRKMKMKMYYISSILVYGDVLK